MSSNSIFLFDIVTSNEKIASECLKAIEQLPKNEPSYFVANLVDSNELNGQYIIVKNTEETYYDPATRAFNTRITPKASIIFFDILNTKLRVWGNKANCNKLVFVLSNIMQNITINAVELQLQELINNLFDNKVKIGKVSFEDFLFTDDIVGNFSVDLSSYGDAYEVLNKYREKISRLTVTLQCNNENLKLNLTSKGTITIFKQRDQMDDESLGMLFSLLKK